MKSLNVLIAAALCAVVGCLGDDDGGGGASGTNPPTLSWYRSCGAPVCGPTTDGPTGDPLCTTEQQPGGGCSTRDVACDPGLGCQVRLVCTDEDPTMLNGGCPISRARYKEDIRYLTQAQQRALADQLRALPLATFRYRGPSGERTQLGFVIEDVAPSPSVAGDHVDLYGFTSMAVATLQQQDAELRAVRAEVATLKAAIEALAVRGESGR